MILQVSALQRQQQSENMHFSRMFEKIHLKIPVV